MLEKEKFWLTAFHPFPTMFSKGIFPRVIKSWDCLVKGYSLMRLFFEKAENMMGKGET